MIQGTFAKWNLLHLPDAHIGGRRELTRAGLENATLCVNVPDLHGTIRKLPACIWETEAGGRLGPLRWWPCKILVGQTRVDGWLVRHDNTRTNYLEVMTVKSFAGVPFRTPVALSLDEAEPVIAAPAARPTPSVRQRPQPPARRPPPPPRPRPVAATRRPAIAPLIAPPPVDGLRAVVLGGAYCVWDDFRRLEEMLGHDWDGLVIAANDVGCHWPRRLDHWCTLHPEKIQKWVQERKAHGHPDGFQTWTRAGGKGVDHAITPWAGGASGLLAVQIAYQVGCSKVVLCGVPMTKEPHFVESKVHIATRPWTSVESHWKAWTKTEMIARLKDRVRSMSGRTMALIGAPDAEWIKTKEVAA